MTPVELKELRFGAQLKMRELAERLGVTISLISMWERGKSPIPKKWEKDILRACGSVEKDAKESTPEPVQVRIFQTVELGPETMRAIKDLIETAVRQLRMIPISPDVLKAEKEGDRYRAKTQEVLGRGW